MSRTTTPKKQTTISPAIAAAAKETRSKRHDDSKRKETLSAQVQPAVKAKPRTNEELLRQGLMLLKQQLTAQLTVAVSRDELLKDYKAQDKVLREMTTKRDNLTKNIAERSKQLRALKEQLDELPEEVNVRLDLAKVSAALDGNLITEVDEEMQQHMEWHGGQIFQAPTTPIRDDDSLPEEGEVQEVDVDDTVSEEEDPLARALLGSS